MDNKELIGEHEDADADASNGMSGRELHRKVTFLAALGGVAIPQNNRFRNGDEPLPDDIRANKRDGDEYVTIGDALKKGGVLKAIVIGFTALLAVFLLINGIFIWGGVGGSLLQILLGLFS